MDRWTHAATVRLRAAALWLAVTAVLTGVGALAVPPAHALATSPAEDFTGLLVQLCSVAALAAGGWLWLVTSGVVVEAARCSASAADGAVPGPGVVRRTLLAACGVAVLTATPAAAADDTGADRRTAPILPASALHGLALPDRTAGALPDAIPGGPPQTAPVALVRAGDSLWSIAARHLGPTAGAAEVAAYWRRIHRLNADLIGPDPHLVVPGQQLRLPPGDHRPRRRNP